jgi:hypothetical protein
MLRKLVFAVLALLVLLPASSGAAFSKVLQGTVQEDSYLHRLNRPTEGTGTLQGGAESTTRIRRPTSDGLSGGVGLVDTAAFAPLAGRAGAVGGPLKSGLVDSGAFSAPPKNFDLGAERESREMVLAWERWHKQLSSAIYQRWSERANSPGRATVRVTVTRDRHLTAEILSCDGGASFEAGLIDAMESLDGNVGLTFPAKSNRQKVHFEADYVAGRNVNPGYSWIKNDYEKVREER